MHNYNNSVFPNRSTNLEFPPPIFSFMNLPNTSQIRPKLALENNFPKTFQSSTKEKWSEIKKKVPLARITRPSEPPLLAVSFFCYSRTSHFFHLCPQPNFDSRFYNSGLVDERGGRGEGGGGEDDWVGRRGRKSSELAWKELGHRAEWESRAMPANCRWDKWDA